MKIPSEAYWRRLCSPLETLLRGGLPPETLARALALGMLVGCMPLVWGTSLLCLGTALLLRLNPLAVQIGNFAAWPLQILLAYPYLLLGKFWFGPAAPSSSPELASLLELVVTANGAALGAWALTVPLLFPVCYAAGRTLVAGASRISLSGFNDTGGTAHVRESLNAIDGEAEHGR